MTNMAGEPVWYELMTQDLSATRPFYMNVVRWKIGRSPEELEGVGDYEFIMREDGGLTGGAIQLTDEMTAGGARPMWTVYFAADDVDAAVARVKELGGSVLMEAHDLGDIGRLAFVADPHGIPFYLMRGNSPEKSQVYDTASTSFGQCGWNELTTPDLDASLAFYGELLGFAVNERMTMPGDAGDYCFLDLGDLRLGAAMTASDAWPAGWKPYFRVADVDGAKSAVDANGGKVLMGPHEVPGDEMILVAHDPEGSTFGLVAPKKA
ncbi:VOC family protein [Croceicoccus pelagius]|uniref:Glyoxalase n=1 Tax=Croceicoccus pelagius TaxID=1703341 RepID=A0A917DEJ2_9SPHN|nr:VOC family protein [Croceicoccus pelagius]GGD33738.1 glyoxalase [Croceicoccus pelagius]